MNLPEIIKNTTKADRFLLAFLIVFCLGGLIYFKKLIPGRQTVTVEAEGRPAYMLPLNKDRTIEVKGSEGITVVEIKDMKVRIKSSPCSNRLCMKQGWIKSGSVICLPNRVIVLIGDRQPEGNGLDAVAG